MKKVTVVYNSIFSARHYLKANPLPGPPLFRPKGAESPTNRTRFPGSYPPHWGERLYFPKTSFSRTFPASRSRLHCPHRPHPHPWRNPRPQPHEDQVSEPGAWGPSRAGWASWGLSNPSPGRLYRQTMGYPFSEVPGTLAAWTQCWVGGAGRTRGRPQRPP